MPLLSIETNAVCPSARRQALIRGASRLLATALGKPEGYVMVCLRTNPDLCLGGSDEPLAYLELKSIGLPEQATTELSRALTDYLHTELDLPAGRVYIEFANAARHLWGWNGGTF